MQSVKAEAAAFASSTAPTEGRRDCALSAVLFGLGVHCADFEDVSFGGFLRRGPCEEDLRREQPESV